MPQMFVRGEDPEHFDYLLRHGKIAEYHDWETDSKYFGFTPDARREKLGLPEPKGFHILHKGVSQP